MSVPKSPKVFKTRTPIKFHHADLAQIMYFANIFSLAHDAFEEFVVDAGYAWEDWFHGKEYIVPIRHTEAEYFKSLLPGKVYDTHVFVEKLGETSFKMKYEFYGENQLHALVRMVHVTLEARERKKISLPPLMIERLQPYLKES